MSYHLARKENRPCESKMLKTISKTYYPGFRRLFQALLLNFFVPMLSGLSNWVRRPIPPPPFKLLSNLPGRDPSPVLLDFWRIMSGTKKTWLGWRCNTFLKPFRSNPTPFSFLWSMTPCRRRREKRYPDADGIKIMPVTWPMSLDINGSFRP